MDKESVKLQRNDEISSAKISVPMAICRLKGWSDKTRLQWREKNGDLVLEEAGEV
jgi:hypothetical protein